jgi:hypothetical protein
MNPLVSFAILFVAIYLSECVAWVRRGALVLKAPLFGMSGWLGRYLPRSLSSASRAVGTTGGSLAVLMPLPPFGRPFVVEAWPFTPTVDGVVSGSSLVLEDAPRAAIAAKRLAWDDIRTIAVIGNEVMINGEVFCAAASAGHAQVGADVLRAMQQATAVERDQLLDRLVANSLDVVRVQALLTRSAQALQPLLASLVVLFITVFITVPVHVYKRGLDNWEPMLMSVVGIMSVSSLLFFFAHRALLPKATGERVLQTFLSLLLPTLTLRTLDKASKPFLAGVHPLAVAMVALHGKERERVLGALWRDVQHPRRPALPTTDDALLLMDVDFRHRVLRLGHDALAARGLPVPAAQPVVRAGVPLHCPRCWQRYRQGDSCSDCGGVPLVLTDNLQNNSGEVAPAAAASSTTT